MTDKLPKLIRRARTAARTIAQALVSAVRGRMFQLLVDLYRAIDGRLPVHIGYVKEDGTASVRTIEPHRLELTSEAEITVRAFDHLRDRDQTFRVDRITSADFQVQPEPTAARPAEQGATVNAALTADIAARLTSDPDFADDVRFWTRLYLWSAEGTHRNVASAHAAYGYDLAELLGTPDLRGLELDAAAVEALAVLDAPVTRLIAAAEAIGDPVLAAVTHCVYGPGVLSGCS